MKSRNAALTLITVASIAASANAQPFIEIEFDATKEINPGGVTIINARVVFDANEDAISADTFNLIDAEVDIHQRPYTQFAGSVEPDPNRASFSFDDLDTKLVGSVANILGFSLGDSTSAFELSIGIVGTQPAVQPPLDTLPDDPALYMIDPAAGISGMDINLTINGQTTELSEFGNMGSVINRNASIHYTVRVVDDPRIEECAADLNNDGRLDFFDVSTFLQLYQAGCP